MSQSARAEFCATQGSTTEPTSRPVSDGGDGMKLAEQTAAKIGLSIVEQGWPLGMVIGSEADLLAEYGVSRAVLREAVRLLEHDHVAHMRRGPGGGLVVAEPDADAVTRVASIYLRYRTVSPGQLFGARMALELAAVRSAAEHIDERGVARLREALDHETAGGEANANSHYFHLVVAQLSGNPAIELFTDVVTALSATAYHGIAGLIDDTAAATQGGDAGVHQGIAEAIIAGDVALAQHRTTRHLQAMAAAASTSAGRVDLNSG
jgi:DNA-binding FadR family transcriptional regulator